MAMALGIVNVPDEIDGTGGGDGQVWTANGANGAGWENAAGGGATYKVYTALLSQTGENAPVATVLENTLGGEPVWSRLQAGYYQGTLTGEFLAGKTIVTMNVARDPTVTNMATVARDSDDAVSVSTNGSDDILSSLIDAIEIRVYP